MFLQTENATFPQIPTQTVCWSHMVQTHVNNTLQPAGPQGPTVWVDTRESSRNSDTGCIHEVFTWDLMNPSGRERRASPWPNVNG